MRREDEAGLPSAATADAWLAELEVARPDREAVLAVRPELTASPALSAQLRAHRDQLVAGLGDPRPLGPWADLDRPWAELGPPWNALVARQGIRNLFYVWVFLSALPAVRAFHARHGVTHRGGSRILANLASQLGSYRSLHGVAGLSEQNWLTRHFRGVIFDFGRLHVERTYFDLTLPSGTGPEPGEPVLSLHIPEGRLTPAACDESIAEATTFVRREYGHERYRFAVCVSWVLDPQLRAYLAAHSNILAFQRRFDLAPGTGADSTGTVVEFVFNRPASDLDALPQQTSLQRALVTHARAGRPWHFRTGWFPL
ncbi:acyltransferase domain-containing protein [Jiangella endophytica]|uniref:acyltransferase domain-containing protein n=1 Tax=Jiangella endophytica TaxID=1623398 RepID=UPI001300969F|nr:acyltransferase domain-containing protein [Jiangella endophytica]